jgi:hypothetical protein
MGLILIYGGCYEFLGWFRARSRLRRVPGVIVGTEEVLGRGPGIHSRSGRFRIVTEQAKVIDKKKAASIRFPKKGSASPSRCPMIRRTLGERGDRLGGEAEDAVFLAPGPRASRRRSHMKRPRPAGRARSAERGLGGRRQETSVSS